MKPESPIKLVSELLDLPLYDTDGCYCGIVDDVELSGEPGKELRFKALLVGPGAYSGRLPRWAMWFVKRVAGDGVTRLPVEKIKRIQAAVYVDGRASDLGLNKSEAAARKWIPRWGAL